VDQKQVNQICPKTRTGHQLRWKFHQTFINFDESFDPLQMLTYYIILYFDVVWLHSLQNPRFITFRSVM